MIPFGLYLVLIASGFLAQTVLHGSSRMVFDLLVGFSAGLTAAGFSNFLASMLCFGVFLKMLVSGYVHCSALMVLYIVVGAIIGFSIS
jgi:hypothetical protein